LINNKLIEFYFDQYILWSLMFYYYPLYQLGQQDEWTKMGITLNGARPIN